MIAEEGKTFLKRKAFVAGLAAAMALLLLVAAQWVPFGFKTTGLAEEWGLIKAAEQGRLVSPGYNPHRPLTTVPWSVGYLLSPNSFLGTNLVHAFAFFGKALFLYLILTRLRIPRVVAFVAACLLVVYPSDAGLFTLRTTHIHVSVFLYLVGTFLYLEFVRSRSWMAILGSWLAIAVSVSIYEIAFPLIFITPLLGLWQQRRCSRSLLNASAIWLVVPMVAFARFLILFFSGKAERAVSLSAGTGFDWETISSMASRLGVAYQRNIWSGWMETIEILKHGTDYFAVSAAVALLVAGVAWYQLRLGASEIAEPDATRDLLVVCGVGLAIIAVGFLPYLPTVIRNQIWRVYILPSIGAAAAFSSALYLMTRAFRPRRFRDAAFIALATSCAFLATNNAHHQHRRFAEYSSTQQKILARTIEQAPAVEDRSGLLLLDASGEILKKPWLFGKWGDRWIEAMSYAYKNYTWWGGVCDGSGDQSSFPQCRVENETINLDSKIRRRTPPVALERVVLFEHRMVDGEPVIRILEKVPEFLAPAGRTTTYDPLERIDATAPLPERVHTLFADWPPK